MTLITHLRRHSTLRRLGKMLEKNTKTWIYRYLESTSSATSATPDTLKNVQRVLLIRPNFRIGNALISARLIKAFADSRPDIEIDYLATDTTLALFDEMPLEHCYALQRDMLLRPWRLYALWRTLRQRHYDLAIHVADTSLTGWLCLKASGAQHTMGADARLKGSYDSVYPVQKGTTHAYDMAVTIAQTLGLTCTAKPWMVITNHEQQQAKAILQTLSETPFAIGLFVGGHLDKRLPVTFWQALCEEFNTRHIPFVVLIGPEEERLRPELQTCVGTYGHIAPGMPLRTFAAVLTQLPRLVTPDTGPMHMAVALDIPVTALLNAATSQKFSPRGAADQVLISPQPTAVVEAIINRRKLDHPLSGDVERTQHSPNVLNF